MRTSVFAFLIALFCVATLPAQAENPCLAADPGGAELQLASSDSGIGGTGLSGDESGIGGTGRSDKDESGIGGTGYDAGDESGIGGTGIYGTITAFGSICVNGLRIHYDDETPVSVDGASASPGELAVGQVVAVEATGDGSELRASKVSVESALTGPITSLDYEKNVLTVMGQRVIVPEAFGEERFPLEVGMRATVDGLRRGDGAVDANRIAKPSADQPDSVSGIVRWVKRGVVEIGGIRVRVDDSRRTRLEDGHFARASGSWNGERRTFDRSVVTASPLLGAAAKQLSVEGYVQRLPGDDRVWVSGVEVDRTTLDRAIGTSERPERVRISGRRDKIGRLRVERVHRVDRPTVRRDFEQARRVESERRKKPPKPENVRKVRPRPPDRPRIEKPPERPPRPERPEPVDRPPLIDYERLRTMD